MTEVGPQLPGQEGMLLRKISSDNQRRRRAVEIRGSGKSISVPLEGVEACDASFVKTPFGVWIVRIDRLLLKDGRTLTVDDFEWTKVASAAGGER